MTPVLLQHKSRDASQDAQHLSLNRVKQINKTTFYSLILLGIACLWNINGLLVLGFGTERLASGFILLFCVLIWSQNLANFSASLGTSGILHLTFTCLFLTLASISRFEGNEFLSHLASLIITSSTAMATFSVLRARNAPRLMKSVASLACLGAFTILLSPYLGDLYASMQKAARNIAAGRWLGFFANPNESGFAAVNGLATVLPLYAIRKTRSKPFQSAGLVICLLVVCVVLTFSRAAILSFFILLALSFTFYFRLDARSLRIAFFASLAMILGFWFFTSGWREFDWTVEQSKRLSGIERMLTFSSLEAEDTGGRENGITQGIAYWSERPFLGHGLGSFHRMPYRYFKGLGCHNTHVMVLGESGLLGFLAYIVFLGSCFLRSLNLPDPSSKLFCLLIFTSFFLQGMVDHGVLELRSSNFLIGVAFGIQGYTEHTKLRSLFHSSSQFLVK